MRTPTLFARSLLPLLAVAAALLTACAPPEGVSIDWSIGPIKFTLTSDGNIDISGQKQWVTAIGTFSVGDDHSVTDKDEKLVLVIRHLRDSVPVDDVFTVPTTADVLVDLDGRTQVAVRGRTITLDATHAVIREISLKGVVWEMPDLRGRTLQDAQDELQRISNEVVEYRSSYDASGRARSVMWHADWKVCTQSVAPRQQITADSTIGFGVVKNDETCPDGSVVNSPVWTLPSFVGHPLVEADSELARLSGGELQKPNTHDATGAGRSPYFRESWVVCSQTPPPLSTISAATPVEFGVVGDDETCPPTAY